MYDSDDVLRVETIFGDVVAFKDDLITKQLQDYGAHIRCELAFLLHFVQAGDVVVDLGAHIGTFTLPLALKAGPKGKVYALEADPRNYALLAANVDNAQLSERVQLENGFVGDPFKAYRLVQNPQNTAMSQVFAANGIGTKRATTLDQLTESALSVDVVKIALQGMELECLRGGEFVLSNYRPVLYVQIHPPSLEQYGTRPEAIETFLRERGYRFFINVGERNAAHDSFVVKEIEGLTGHGALINALAIHEESDRLSRALNL